MTARHFDDARRDVLGALNELGRAQPTRRFVLVEASAAKLRLLVEDNGSANLQEGSLDALVDAAQPFWSPDVFYADSRKRADELLFIEAWDRGAPISSNVRFVRRVRAHSGWFRDVVPVLWTDGPTLVAFVSPKGGVGRTTVLAGFAETCAARGETAAILDLDFDAPGAAALIGGETASPWGILDFLVERASITAPLSDYYVTVNPAGAAGQIFLFPAGDVNSDYLDKLARVDLDDMQVASDGIIALLNRIKDELTPDWVLLDSRSGLSEVAALATSGIANVVVIAGTAAEQAWPTTEVIIARLGKARLDAGLGQADCVMVQNLVPNESTLRASLTARFAQRSQDAFSRSYYAEAGSAVEESAWTLSDIDSQDAPHVQVVIGYEERFSQIDTAATVAQFWSKLEGFGRLAERIEERANRPHSEADVEADK